MNDVIFKRTNEGFGKYVLIYPKDGIDGLDGSIDFKSFSIFSGKPEIEFGLFSIETDNEIEPSEKIKDYRRYLLIEQLTQDVCLIRTFNYGIYFRYFGVCNSEVIDDENNYMCTMSVYDEHMKLIDRKEILTKKAQGRIPDDEL